MAQKLYKVLLSVQHSLHRKWTVQQKVCLSYDASPAGMATRTTLANIVVLSCFMHTVYAKLIIYMDCNFEICTMHFQIKMEI